MAIKKNAEESNLRCRKKTKFFTSQNRMSAGKYLSVFSRQMEALYIKLPQFFFSCWVMYWKRKMQKMLNFKPALQVQTNGGR